jgi:hypothetical protein
VKSLNIPILKNGTEVRQTFIKKFTIPWDEFQISHKKWIDYAATQNYKVTYEKLHLWELMDYRAISFTRSLEFLRAMPGEMYLMSENEINKIVYSYSQKSRTSVRDFFHSPNGGITPK